jgi:hypothetical protein
VTSRRALKRRRELERRAPGRPVPGRVAGGGDEAAAVARMTRAAEDVGRELAGLLERPEAVGLLGWGRAQHLHVQRAAVAAELQQAPPPVPGGCYEASTLYVLGHRDADIILVHGLIVEADLPLAHAFVALPGEVIFDPSTADFYQAGSYAEVLQAVAACTHRPRVRAGHRREGPRPVGRLPAGVHQGPRRAHGCLRRRPPGTC